jgi:hypothetical protein
MRRLLLIVSLLSVVACQPPSEGDHDSNREAALQKILAVPDLRLVSDCTGGFGPDTQSVRVTTRDSQRVVTYWFGGEPSDLQPVAFTSEHEKLIRRFVEVSRSPADTTVLRFPECDTYTLSAGEYRLRVDSEDPRLDSLYLALANAGR